MSPRLAVGAVFGLAVAGLSVSALYWLQRAAPDPAAVAEAPRAPVRVEQHVDPPAPDAPKPTPDKTQEAPQPPAEKLVRLSRPWSADEARASWQRGGNLWRWNWPEERDFQKHWRTWGTTTMARTVVIATATNEPEKGDQLISLTELSDGTVTLQVIPFPGQYGGGLTGRLETPLAELQPGPFTLNMETEGVPWVAKRVFHPGEWHREAFDDWVYTTTLLTFEPNAKNPPRGNAWNSDKAAEKRWTRVEKAMDKSREAGVAAITEHLDQASSYDSRWQDVISFLGRHDEHDLLLKVYAHYRPVGRCSMDTRPAQIARRHARACARAGRLGCTLQMSVRIMADRFTRTAYSSYGEASHATEADALDRAGVDTDRFLRGLLIDYASDANRPVAIGLWRLSRSMAELDRTEAFAGQLEALAIDPALDELNRLRAAIVLSNVYLKAGHPKDTVAEYVLSLNISETATLWMEKLAADEDEE